MTCRTVQSQTLVASLMLLFAAPPLSAAPCSGDRAALAAVADATEPELNALLELRDRLHQQYWDWFRRVIADGLDCAAYAAEASALQQQLDQLDVGPVQQQLESAADCAAAEQQRLEGMRRTPQVDARRVGVTQLLARLDRLLELAAKIAEKQGRLRQGFEQEFAAPCALLAEPIPLPEPPAAIAPLPNTPSAAAPASGGP